MFRVAISHANEIELPKFENLAILLVIQGSGVSGIYKLEEFSTWYVMPGSQLTLKKTSEADLVVFVANPCSE